MGTSATSLEVNGVFGPRPHHDTHVSVTPLTPLTFDAVIDVPITPIFITHVAVNAPERGALKLRVSGDRGLIAGRLDATREPGA